MKKFLLLLLPALFAFFASFAVYPISGTPGACVGGTSILIDSSYGGTWSSSNTAVATVDAYGHVGGVSAGTAIITYMVGSSYATMTFTVSPIPSAISGSSSVCPGASTTLTDATSGGTWSSSDPAIATVSSSTGVVYGIASGTVEIYYTIGTGCTVADSFVVMGTYPGYITGDSMLCVGSIATLSDYVTGGTWSSSNPSIATIDATSGVIGGVSSGTVTITYTVSGSCGAGYAIWSVNVITTSSAGTISGPATGYVGGTYTYFDYTGSGTWSSSNTSVATIDAYGNCYALAAGTTNISYSVSGCGATVSTSTTLTVYPINRISGTIHFASGAIDSTGSTKVWLITYNSSTHDLEAADSVMAVMTSSTTATYQFMGESADTFRVKAAYTPATFTTMGYIPTYHTSSLHWNTADVFYHTVSSADDGKDINMNYGTATTGPGFIAGDVTSGANRGTSTGVPVPNMLMIAINSSTGAVMQETLTNAAGHYSFANLPVGQSYIIYPEAINYTTTPYPAISLSSTSDTFNAASFIQHTISKTITPIVESVENVTATPSYVTVFPNPAYGKLNIQYQCAEAGRAIVTITDVTGRRVYNSEFNTVKGNGIKAVDLTNINAGLYIVSVKAGDLNFTNKISIEK